MNSTFPNINKNIEKNNFKFHPIFLNDINIVKENLEINKNITHEEMDF